jgi:hypothetical protein
VNGAIDAEVGHEPHRLGEELDEFLLRHLTGGHFEGLMLYRPQSAYMTIDLYVVGRIGEDHLGQLLAHQSGVRGLLECIAA